MKKAISIILVFIIAISLFACSKTVSDDITEKMTETTEKQFVSEKAGMPEISVSAPFSDAEKYILEPDESKTVCEILERCDFEINPIDNMNDSCIFSDGKMYSYDSYNGILTFSDENTEINHEHTALLSEEDKDLLNDIIWQYVRPDIDIVNVSPEDEQFGSSELFSPTPKADTEQDNISKPADGNSIPTLTSEQGEYNPDHNPERETDCDTFVVEKADGKHLTMCKYRIPDGRLKSGLWCGSYADIDGSDSLEFKPGDILNVKYDAEIAETYLFQIKILDIEKIGEE